MLTITNKSALHRNKNIIYSRPSLPLSAPPHSLLVPPSSPPSPLLLETAAVSLPSVVPVSPPISAPVPPPVPAPAAIPAISPAVSVSASIPPLGSLLLYLILQVSQTTAGWVRARGEQKQLDESQ